ncbi:DPY30/SDC1 family protein [Aspergillus foveolatus]|uniref:DPY30/SDC1 family protein n=1 Tax=Aspergillus foveolatus TaxID=210207 RepID=UPI003CCDDB27
MVNETSQMSSAGTGSAHTAAADPIASPVRPGGAPARVYMNEKIVPYLLEGMKTVTKEQPANPLRVLGEFLIQKSNEVEGSQSGSAPE